MVSLINLERKFSKSESLWGEFKEIQFKMLHRDSESSDNKGEVDFARDEEFDVVADGKPRLTRC